MLRLHLLPSFGDKAIADIKEPHVRRWRKTLLDSGTGPVTVAKAYRLLKAIMNTAVEDGLIRKNPCRIKGAGQEASPERPVLTVEQVFRLARSIDERYRALVLLATFGNLRWGELTALRRRDLDLETGTVRVERTLTQAQDGSLTFGPPKSSAGRRIIAIPDVIVPDLAWHLQHIAQQEEDGLVFLGPKGAMLRRGNFARTWRKAIESAGLPDVHFHDLRHTGKTLTAAAGATLRDLMERMGHSSTRAAMVSLHATDERHRVIADALSTLTRRELEQAERASTEKRSGKQRARKRRRAS